MLSLERSEYYDYGCWEPADEAFELAPLDDSDPKYVTLKWYADVC
jgi:hypothetical protein